MSCIRLCSTLPSAPLDDTPPAGTCGRWVEDRLERGQQCLSRTCIWSGCGCGIFARSDISLLFYLSYNVTWCMIWYDVIWHDMIWYDMIWYDVICVSGSSPLWSYWCWLVHVPLWLPRLFPPCVPSPRRPSTAYSLKVMVEVDGRNQESEIDKYALLLACVLVCMHICVTPLPHSLSL